MTRTATLDDIPALVEMGQKFHAMAEMPMGYEPEMIATLLHALIPAGGVFIGDRGCIGGMIAPAYSDSRWAMAVELFWWAESGGLALLSAFEAWGRESGAKEIRMTTLAAHPRADTILRRKGYAPTEISYSKVM